MRVSDILLARERAHAAVVGTRVGSGKIPSRPSSGGGHDHGEAQHGFRRAARKGNFSVIFQWALLLL